MEENLAELHGRRCPRPELLDLLAVAEAVLAATGNARRALCPNYGTDSRQEGTRIEVAAASVVLTRLLAEIRGGHVDPAMERRGPYASSPSRSSSSPPSPASPRPSSCSLLGVLTRSTRWTALSATS